MTAENLITDESRDRQPIDLGAIRMIDVPGFLIGMRPSIERVLASNASLALGAALVVTAALAREYDAISFIHQPLDLLAPFVASVVISAIIFAAIRCFLSIAGILNPSGIGEDYRLFLSGYWMTAPLAWLYAIPIETMADEIQALRFNLTLLSIVSLWRVLLFARFVAVRYQVSVFAALSWVLVPCTAITTVALFQQMMSMVSIMGGLRLTETQQILMDFQSNVFVLTFYGFVPTLLLAIGLAIAIRNDANRIPLRQFRSGLVHRSAWAIPLLAFVLLGSAAALFQPARYRAAEVDRMLIDGRIEAAITVMQRQGQNHFPRVWDPPPTFPTRRRPVPPMSDLLIAIEQTQPDHWVIDRLLVQADELLMRQFGWTQGVGDETYLDSTLYITDPATLRQLHEHLQTLTELPANDDERQRRARLLKIVNDAIPKAEAFAKGEPVSQITEPETEGDGI